MSGKLYALSSGPGAADLITVRAARILGQLDVLYAPAGRKGGDSLALSIVREYLGAHTEVRCCHFPMSTDSAEKEAVWNDVAAALAQEVAAGRQVGFITLGDAMFVQHLGLSAAADWLPGGWRLSLALPPSPPLPRGRKPRWPWSSSRWR